MVEMWVVVDSVCFYFHVGGSCFFTKILKIYYYTVLDSSRLILTVVALFTLSPSFLTTILKPNHTLHLVSRSFSVTTGCGGCVARRLCPAQVGNHTHIHTQTYTHTHTHTC